MNNTDRKMLTEWLGECWHDMREYKIDDTYSVLRCKKCGFIGQRDYRTFDNWQDFGALVDRLKELGLWGELTDDDEYDTWILDPDRCQDIADFVRGRQ